MATMTADPTTEARVKAAAIELFGAKGFAGTGIRELAQAAGISVASLYHYMQTKEDLLLSLMMDGMNALLHPATAALKMRDDPAADLTKLVQIHVTFHCEHDALARVTDAEVHSLAPETRSNIITLRDSYEALWADTIQRGKTKGSFKVGEVHLAKIALLQMCTGVSNWYSPAGRYTIEEIASYYCALALRLLGYPQTALIRRYEGRLRAQTKADRAWASEGQPRGKA